jgi:hypothetical protein
VREHARAHHPSLDPRDTSARMPRHNAFVMKPKECGGFMEVTKRLRRLHQLTEPSAEEH